MDLSAGEIARRLGGRLTGDGAVGIRRAAGIRQAGPGDITFLGHPRYAADAPRTKASALLVGEDWAGSCGAALIRVKDPSRAFAEVGEWLAPAPAPAPAGIHPSAVIAADAVVGRDVAVGPHCVIEGGVRVGDRTALGAGCCIGYGTVIGEDCRLYPHVTAREYTRVGDRVIVHNGAVLGSDGFGYARVGTSWKKIPQIGVVVIEDDVEIGANVTIDRARFGETRIGRGTKIDNLVHVAHNVTIGPDSAIAAQAGIAGSASVGARVQIGGQAGIAGHLTVGDDSVVAGQSGVHGNVPPGSVLFGYPALPQEKAMKIHGQVLRLPALKAKVADLEKRMDALETALRKRPGSE